MAAGSGMIDGWVLRGAYGRSVVPASEYPVQKTRDEIKMAAYSHA